MRTLARLLLFGLAAVWICIPTSAQAERKDVSITSEGFTPRVIWAVQGDLIVWTNNDDVIHGVYGNLGIFSPPWLEPGDHIGQSTAFRNAGTYGYRCTHHADETGAVRVPMIVTGSPEEGWTLQWSSLSSTPNNRTFDVQKRAPGATTWVNYRMNTRARTAFFDPARTGTWHFRARTDIVSNGKSSGWSPAKSVPVA